jgi:hypothetical protein
MTKQVEDLMAIIANEVAAAERGAFDRIRKALEAALTPGGDPACYQYQDSEGKWHPFVNDKHYQNTVGDGRWPIRPLYTAPPAQTPVPPRLTDELLAAIYLEKPRYHYPPIASTDVEFARAIESAVRKQFLGDRDE